MELITNQAPMEMIETTEMVTSPDSFIEANTKKVTLTHLKNECIIPVFSKDNETTISHYQFIGKVSETIQSIFPNVPLLEPDIRVSHVIKGRVPTAIGKPVRELTEEDKTIYYERCAFVIELPQIKANVGGNELSLSIGGVRAYNQENLYSRKSMEKFKIFIGFKNRVCTNLCISTDGLLDQIRVSSVDELEEQVAYLVERYDQQKHIRGMNSLLEQSLDEEQFAHLVGKMKMFQQLERSEKRAIPKLLLNDSQISSLVKGYYHDPNFSCDDNGRIDLWNFYNLLTGANKSSYIDHHLERVVNAYDITQELAFSIENRTPNWLLPQYNIAL